MKTTLTTQKKWIAAAAAVLLSASGPTAYGQSRIAVTVNGTPIQFGGASPTEVGGSVLVPLRGVFEALGASVDYNAATRTINAKKGTANVVLPLGSTMASVNGQAQTLSQPARTVAGTTLVPLRFVAQALGANVAWHAATNTVEIRTTGGAVASTATGNGQMVGQVTAVYPNTAPPQITVRVNGQDTPVPISTNTIILRSAAGSAGTQVALGEIQPGDQVVVQRGGDGSAVSIAATYGAAVGTAQVTEFTQNATRPLRAGDVLTATLRGTPGGKATFSIPGVVDNVAMTESSSGVYTGSYTVPKNVGVTGAAVLGKLVVAGATAPLIQASGNVTIDSIAPKVVEFSPGRGVKVDSDMPQIYGTISDAGGTGINPGEVHVALDNVDVTSQTTITPAFFNVTLTHPLAPGAHSVHVTLVDMAGNQSATEWPFAVTTTKVVQAFTSNIAAGTTLAAGQTVQFTLQAQPGGHATFRVGDTVNDQPMQETSPGIYTGSYTVTQGLNATGAPVTATFVPANGSPVTASLGTALTIAAGAPAAPRIVSPADGAAVGDPLTVTGTAAPNATVLVRVDYTSKAFGIVPITGSAGSQEVKADAQGHWTAGNIALRSNSLLSNDRDTTFTITALVENTGGDNSDPATVSVHKG